MLDQILGSEQIISSFVYKKLKYIKKTIVIKYFYQKLVNNNEELLAKIVLPLSTSTKSEINNIEDSPSEFVAFALDCVGKQRSKLPKSEAICLYENLCDNIDGFVSYSINTFFGSFMYTMLLGDSLLYNFLVFMTRFIN